MIATIRAAVTKVIAARADLERRTYWATRRLFGVPDNYPHDERYPKEKP